MNDKRRRKLREAILLLDNAFGMIQQVCDGEENSMDNIPENLRYSDRYEGMEETAEALSDAVDVIAEVKDMLQTVV